jgi:hydrogenase-4 component F
LRSYHIARSDASAAQAMIFIGLLSMGVSALYMLRQRDLKRLLAYSSVEHMGILALGAGLGGAGLSAALLHVIHNGICKAGMFMAAGNIHRAYGSKMTDEVRGILRCLPVTGTLLLVGFFAITGSPPFGPFVSEYQMIAATFEQGRGWIGILMLGFLLLVFLGMGSTLIGCSFGPCPEREESLHFHDNMAMCGPIVLCMALTIVLGVYTPDFIKEMLHEASSFLNQMPASTAG